MRLRHRVTATACPLQAISGTLSYRIILHFVAHVRYDAELPGSESFAALAVPPSPL